MNLFLIYLESATDPKIYRKLAKEPLFQAFLYLFFLLVLLGLPLVGYKTYVFHQKANIIAEKIRTSVPDFTISEGKLRSAQPFRQVLLRDQDLIVVIDTTGKTRPSIVESRPTGVLITADRFILSNVNSGPAELPFSRFESETLDKQILLDTRWVIEGFLVFWGLFALMVGRILFAFFFASLGFIGTFASARPLSFSQAFALGIYSQSMPFTLQTIMMIFFPLYSQTSNINFVALCVYYTLAIFFVISERPPQE